MALYFYDADDDVTYGPFASEFIAQEYMAEIGMYSAAPTFESTAPVTGARAPSAGFLEMVKLYA